MPRPKNFAKFVYGLWRRRLGFRRVVGRMPPNIAATPEQAAMIAQAKEWGYFSGSIKRRFDLWQGQRMLDVGMGAGPHSLVFAARGVSAYVGLDPYVGTDKVRDFRDKKNPAIPAYHAFPYSVADVMRAFPNIHLYKGTLEERLPDLRRHRFDIAIMDAVSEHLVDPQRVVEGIWQALEPRGLLWIAHCNYYSWTGHHRLPRCVEDWNPDDPEQARHIDWRHLDPAHPDFTNRNYNRVRLEDLRLLIAKYFEIVEWRAEIAARDRLTPEIRARWKQYTLAELLGKNVYITGRRRDAPLEMDLSNRQFHHPDAAYGADRDFTHEPMAPFEFDNLVYFSGNDEVRSHADNNFAGARLMAMLAPGDRVELVKFTQALPFTVRAVRLPANGPARLYLREWVEGGFLEGNHDQWQLRRVE